MERISVLKVGLVAVFACIAAPNAIAEKSKLLEPIFECQNIQNPQQKTQCYDQAVLNLKNTQKTGQFIIIDSKTLNRLAEETFGYELPPISLLKNGENESIPNRKMIRSDVTKVQHFLTGYVFTLKNGQVWEQYTGDISHIPPGKLTAQIKLINSGTYKMTVSNGKHRVKNIKVRRIQ
ncbi:MAG TPA: hypothetical protein ENK06_11850 [Gammaproteobacteria bacterium]|nr:hypothetical protein [Gammaproteobacteria bacterium]